MKEIFQRKYYAGFGDSVSERYYEKDNKFYCSAYSSGYWSSQETVREVQKEDIEKVIRAEQDTHIQALTELNEKLMILKKMP